MGINLAYSSKHMANEDWDKPLPGGSFCIGGRWIPALAKGGPMIVMGIANYAQPPHT